MPGQPGLSRFLGGDSRSPATSTSVSVRRLNRKNHRFTTDLWFCAQLFSQSTVVLSPPLSERTAIPERCGPRLAPGRSSYQRMRMRRRRRASRIRGWTTCLVQPESLEAGSSHPCTSISLNRNHAWISYSGYNFNTPSQPGHVFTITYDPTANTGAGDATWTNLDCGTGPMGHLQCNAAADGHGGDLC
jgi:hypothetical protein